MIADRKYLSEFAVNLFSSRWLIVPASQLMSDGEMDPAAAAISSRCHIYLISRRPACSFDPADFNFDGKQIAGTLIYRVAGVPVRRPFRMAFELSEEAVRAAVSPYPHRDIETYDAKGEAVRYVPANSLALIGVLDDPVLRDFEVLYVGQAYADGKRTAVDRLRSHSTLQKILAEMQHNLPDDEVLILTFEYEPYRVISMFDGIDKKAINDDRDTDRFSSILDNPLSEHAQICLTEAGLIRYFQPHYNEVYKESFPASDQKILDDCYKLDFSALAVEIDTTELGVELRSETVASSGHHIGNFDLVDLKERRSFFSFVDRNGKAYDMPGVIPRSR